MNQFIMFDSLKPQTTYDNMFSRAYGMPIKTVPYKFNTWSKIKISTTKECCPDIKVLLEILKYDVSNKTNKSIYDLFSELNIPRCENIKATIYSFDESGIPILTPPLYIEN